MGNYEYINYGWQTESLRVLTGAPSFMTPLDSSGPYTSSNIWSTISGALGRGFNIGVDTSGSYFGLAGSHAYHVIGAFSLKDANGNVVQNLMRVRNPWGYDTYSGPWSDADSKWTSQYQS